MKLILYILSLFIATSIFAQDKIYQAKWQQNANYNITVTLNDDSNYLTGFETIEYTNNSPDALNEIYIHLYPNAYKNNNTAYAKENIAKKETAFWMAEDKDRGFITNLNFKTEGQTLKLKYSNYTPDNAKLILEKPLAPGATIKITTPFTVKIPYTFSRLGHVGQSYQISQWYPKIAVYDVNGWNQFPYLDQGEFYSDYGNYDVTITLPKNYLVAATGNLQTEDEIEWLKKRANEKLKMNNEFSSEAMKTIRYTENNVHDFAFFADKRWCVALEDITLTSGKKVSMQVFDTVYDNAKNGLKYIRKTLKYLSDHVGEYPYNTAKSCTGALVSGAGMEYPTVTIVGHQHEAEVVHEIGHNWFYGILGSNERRYPWMDEGVNTYYEMAICTEKEKNNFKKFTEIITGTDFEFNNRNLEWLVGKINTSRGEDAPVGMTSSFYSDANYGAIIYYRTALNFIYLESYLGAAIFDSCMQNYFSLWHHKHPLPGDMKNCFEQISGKSLGWFFEGLINVNQNYDLKINKIIKEDKGKELEIHLTNKSGKAVAVPMKVSNANTSSTIWIEPFNKDTIIHIHNLEYSKIELNANSYLVETNINNNFYFLDKNSPKALKPQLRISFGLENRYRRTLFISPIAGVNSFNRLMLGVALYNSTIVRKQWEYLLAPLYSFEKKNLNGFANLTYTLMPRGNKINTANIGIKTAKFNSRINIYSPIVYYRIQPYVKLNFTKPTNASKLERYIKIDFTSLIQNKELQADSFFKDNKKHFLNIEYFHENKSILHPYKVRLWIEKNINDKVNDYLRLGLKAQYKLAYDNPKKKLTIDLFMGKVRYFKTNNNGAYDFYLASESPSTDYKYWNLMVNRDPSTQNTQILDEQGAIRSNVLPFNTSNIAATLRFRSHLPFTNVIRPYLDFGTYNGMKQDFNLKFFYTSGISVVLFEEALEINFPLAITRKYDLAGNTQFEVQKSFRFAQSNIINDAIAANGYNYWQTVSVLINLNKLNPLHFLQNIPLGK